MNTSFPSNTPDELAWLSSWRVPTEHIAEVTGATPAEVERWAIGDAFPDGDQSLRLNAFVVQARQVFHGEPPEEAHNILIVERDSTNPIIVANRRGAISPEQRAILGHLGLIGLVSSIGGGVIAVEGVLNRQYSDHIVPDRNGDGSLSTVRWFTIGTVTNRVPEKLYRALAPADGRLVRVYLTKHLHMPVAVELLDTVAGAPPAPAPPEGTPVPR